MIEFWQNFHFLRPWFLLFLLVPGILYFFKLKKLATISSWEEVCDKNLLQFLLINNSSTKKLSVLKFIYIGLTTAALAAAGPAWKKIEIPALSLENPNMFVISLAQDMQLKDISPSRLDRAKFMLSDITDNINQGQFGITVYSQEPYVVTPLTEDIQLIKNILPQIVPDVVPDNGDRLDRAIDLAMKRFKSADYVSGNIILFASDVGQRFDFALEKTKQAVAHNYAIHVIDTSFEGNEKLQLLAENGKGVYLRVQETNPYKLTESINNSLQHRITQNDNSRSDYADNGYYLLFIVLICMLSFFRRGLLIVMFCCFAQQAYAGFLLNNNQEGFSYFNQGEYDKALEKFQTPEWRGIVLYHKNQLEDALKEFEKSKSAEAIYNKGVVLVKLCQYQEAFAVFDEALKKAPQNEDALYNKQIMADLLEKAKEDPSILDCQNNQENNNQQNNDNNEDQNQQNQNSQNEDQSEQSQSENSNNQNSPQEEQSDDENLDKSEQPQNTDSTDNQQPNNDQSEQISDTNNPSDSQEDTSESNNSDNNQENNTEQQNSQEQPNNQDTNSEQSDKSSQQQMQMINATEGDENEQYDEEALALQRRYREIPEDVGGLLREFIKKEYLKDRYNNENI